MITPKDIETKEFTTTKGGGYKAEEVDQFLDEILVDYTHLLEERNSLKNKVNLLTEKLTSMAHAAAATPAPAPEVPLVTPPQSASDDLSAARKKAQRLVSDAEDYAKKLIETAQFEANRQNAVSQKLASEIETFKNSLLDTYAAHVKLIEEIPGMKFENAKVGSETLDILNQSFAPASVPAAVSEPAVPSAESLINGITSATPASEEPSSSLLFEETTVFPVATAAQEPKRSPKGLEDLFNEDELKQKKKEPKKKKKLFFRDEEEDDDFFDDDDE